MDLKSDKQMKCIVLGEIQGKTHTMTKLHKYRTISIKWKINKISNHIWLELFSQVLSVDLNWLFFFLIFFFIEDRNWRWKNREINFSSDWDGLVLVSSAFLKQKEIFQAFVFFMSRRILFCFNDGFYLLLFYFIHWINSYS